MLVVWALDTASCPVSLREARFFFALEQVCLGTFVQSVSETHLLNPKMVLHNPSLG